MTRAIRRATIADAPALYPVMVDAEYLQFFRGTSAAEVVPQIIERFFLPDKEVSVIVAEESGRIIGYSIFGPYARYKQKTFPEEKEKYAYSLGTGVLKDCRKRGIGEQLRLAADALAQQQGYKGLYTDVATSNAASLRVQEKARLTQVAIVNDPKREAGVGSVIFKKEF